MSMSLRKDENVLLIACYGDYTGSSLDTMKKMIKERQPDRIVISKIIKREYSSSVVRATVGMKEREGFTECLRNHNKEITDDFAQEIIKYADSLEIPTEVYLRTGDDISHEIISESDRVDAGKIVIRKTSKGPFMKIIEGCTEDDVYRNIPKEKIISLR